MSTKPNEFFCLLDMRDRPVAFTVRGRRKDVPAAAEEWSGHTFENLKRYGYRIAKVFIEEVSK